MNRPISLNLIIEEVIMLNRILILQHKGGEYISINISSLEDNHELIWETIRQAEKRLLKPSTTTNVAIQILDTKFNQMIADEIVDWLIKMKKDIFRLAIIGATIRHKRTLKKSFR